MELVPTRGKLNNEVGVQRRKTRQEKTPVRHWLLLVAGLLMLTGCGTVEGLGKDISDVARWSRGQISR